MSKVTSQRAIDIQKISDLKECIESSSERTVWMIDGEEFVYCKGDEFLKSRAGLSADWQIWPLEDIGKRAAKAKVFNIIK